MKSDIRMLRPPRVALLAALVAVLVALPAGIVLASHQFSDVPSTNPFHGDIDALATSGVTAGCGGGRFCPTDNVTRQEMAAFMNRLGALAPNKTPIVNADRLDGLHASALNRVAFAQASNDALVGTSGKVLSTTITAPGPGYLVISASSDVYNLVADNPSLQCLLTVNNAPIGSSWREVRLMVDTNPETNCATNAVHVVPSAATFAVALEASAVFPDTHFDESTLVVQYVPFGPMGSTAGLAPDAPPAPGGQPNE